MIRRNARADVFFLCGCIFTPIGIVVLVLAVVMAGNIDYLIAHGEGDVELLPWIFGLIGSVAAVIGIALLTRSARMRIKRRLLIENGESVTAEITAIPCNYAVRVNGCPTFKVECRYTDPVTRVVHVFESENLLLDPTCYIDQSTTVRVYVDRESGYKNYSVDIDSILPEIQRH